MSAVVASSSRGRQLTSYTCYFTQQNLDSGEWDIVNFNPSRIWIKPPGSSRRVWVFSPVTQDGRLVLWDSDNHGRFELMDRRYGRIHWAVYHAGWREWIMQGHDLEGLPSNPQDSSNKDTRDVSPRRSESPAGRVWELPSGQRRIQEGGSNQTSPASSRSASTASTASGSRASSTSSGRRRTELRSRLAEVDPARLRALVLARRS